MKKIPTQSGVCALAAPLMVPFAQALSDNDLEAPVTRFGRDMTHQDSLMLIIEGQHEHLEYRRRNGVVPPWSKQDCSTLGTK